MYLDTPALMVDVVVAGIIRSDELQRIPRQSISAVVVYCLEGRASEEAHSLSWRQSSQHVGNARAQDVQQESFKGMIVECTERVWDVQPVVSRVEST